MIFEYISPVFDSIHHHLSPHNLGKQRLTFTRLLWICFQLLKHEKNTILLPSTWSSREKNSANITSPIDLHFKWDDETILSFFHCFCEVSFDTSQKTERCIQRRYFKTFKGEPRNRFQGVYSTSLYSSVTVRQPYSYSIPDPT
jgi:hypothetical protein